MQGVLSLLGHCLPFSFFPSFMCLTPWWENLGFHHFHPHLVHSAKPRHKYLQGKRLKRLKNLICEVHSYTQTHSSDLVSNSSEPSGDGNLSLSKCGLHRYGPSHLIVFRTQDRSFLSSWRTVSYPRGPKADEQRPGDIPGSLPLDSTASHRHTPISLGLKVLTSYLCQVFKRRTLSYRLL